MATSSTSPTVQGDCIPQPISDLTKLGLNPTLMTAASKRRLTKPLLLQTYMWPIVMNGRNVVCVSKATSGKTMGFIMPILSCIMENAKQSNKNADDSDDHGPIALILVSSSQTAEKIGKIITLLAAANDKVRCVVLHSEMPESDAYCQLLNGCSILVSTPHAFLKALSTPPSLPYTFTNLRRIAHLVIDEGESLLSRCKESIAKILREIGLALLERRRADGSAGVQFITTASELTADVQEFYESLRPHQPVLIKGAGVKDQKNQDH